MPIPNRHSGWEQAYEDLKNLLADAEFLDKGTVACQVVLLQIVKQTPATAYQVHQAAVGGKIFFVGLQMRRNLVHALRDKGNLAFNRPGVGSSAAEFRKNACFFFFCY